MNLELKHLANYLPFRLKIKTDYKNMVHEMLAIHIQLQKVDTRNLGWCKFCEIKPIFHPFSDLEKEIEVDGVKFNPIEIILDEINSMVVGGDEYTKEEVIKMCNNSYYAESWISERLFEWHFDVFGLIEKGLAISIHDVEQADA
jgi:hypothetical protein